MRILGLNLLTVFDAIMRERNVSKAGQRLGLSHSAVSYALNRLRHVLRDDLFVRTSHGMVPTPAAERIAEPISQSLADLRLALEPQAFVPFEAKRSFAATVDSFAPGAKRKPLNTQPGIGEETPTSLRNLPRGVAR